jgi:hypothetical protein
VVGFGKKENSLSIGRTKMMVCWCAPVQAEERQPTLKETGKIWDRKLGRIAAAGRLGTVGMGQKVNGQQEKRGQRSNANGEEVNVGAANGKQ